jgi:hypothetical protein
MKLLARLLPVCEKVDRIYDSAIPQTSPFRDTRDLLLILRKALWDGQDAGLLTS